MYARNVDNFAFIIAIKDVLYEHCHIIEIFTLPAEQIEINEHCFSFQIYYYLILQWAAVFF